MNLDFLKGIKAKVEGRTAIIVAGLVFCGFCLWLFMPHPGAIGGGSVGFQVGAFLLACAIVLIPLLGKPQPSEPEQPYLLQQVGNQWFFTGGHHSTDELIRLLREANNVQPLPLASATVIGSPKDSGQYKPLSDTEAKELQRQDETGVERMLREQADRIRDAIQSAQLSGGAVEDTKALPARDPGTRSG